jgi:hypothetical protein
MNTLLVPQEVNRFQGKKHSRVQPMSQLANPKENGVASYALLLRDPNQL